MNSFCIEFDDGVTVISFRKFATVLICMLVLAGCSIVPSSGPLTNAVLNNATADSSESKSQIETNYLVADIDSQVLDTLKAEPVPKLRDVFGDSKSPAQGTIRPGDQIAVTIWETGPGGLFSGGSATTISTAPSQVTQIPPQVVSSDGTVLVPYAGRVKVVDMTAPDAQALIQTRLRGTAAQPQVLVTITQGVSDQITISGDDIKGALVPLNTSPARILDVIALAGGIQSPTYSAWAQLIRDGESITVPLQSIVQNTTENIKLHPGDTLIVSKIPEFFTVLGAAGKSSELLFDADQVNLTEALGRAGGLLDERADPAGVFVFRYESKKTAKLLCTSCRFSESQTLVPVVLRLDMRKPESFFAAQSFQMANHDLLYIADAQLVPIQKVLAVMRDFLSPILTGAVVGRAINN